MNTCSTENSASSTLEGPLTPAVTADALDTPAVLEDERAEQETEEEDKADQVFEGAHTARYVLCASVTVL